MCAAHSGADAQFAPAGADFEDTAARRDSRRVEDPFDLSVLRIREAGLMGGQGIEERTRVRHGLVEELGEHDVREIVVVGDIATGLPTAVVLRPRWTYDGQRPESLQGRRNQLSQTLAELGEQS